MKKIFVIFIVFSFFISSLLSITGCQTEGKKNTCTTYEEGYLKMNDGSNYVNGYVTQDANVCATYSTGN